MKRTLNSDTPLDLKDGFKAVASDERAPSEPPKASSSITFRVSAQERSQLEADALGLSLSAYVRGRLFNADTPKSRIIGKAPVKDHAALARVLSALGRSQIARDLQTLDWAERDGVLYLDPTAGRALRQAATDIAAMREDLIRALGLRDPRRQ